MRLREGISGMARELGNSAGDAMSARPELVRRKRPESLLLEETMTRTRAATVTFAFALTFAPAVAHAEGPARLPLRTVRFYEVGVGYFERKGQLDGASTLTLPLPTSQLDDALKSLVVLSSDGKARLAAVEFDSTVGPELGRALAGLEGVSEAPLDWVRVLRSMKGADVAVQTRGDTIRGRLVDVLDASADERGECVEPIPQQVSVKAGEGVSNHCRALAKSASLVMLTSEGSLKRIRSTEVQGVKPRDAGLSDRLRTALSAVVPGSDQLSRGVRVLGTPGSQVTLGYVTETPVWRSTYRVVFQGAKAALQGWALIHNDSDEAWRGVRVELVNGRPDAFLYPLAAPRYARRDLVTPENALSTVPQLLADGSPDRQWRGESGGLGLRGVGEGGGGRGEGIGLGTIGTIGRGSGSGVTKGTNGASDAPSTELSVGSLAGVAGATGAASEALFRYSLPDAIDLRPHGSALVPFLSQASFAAKRVTWFAHAGETGRSAARLQNDTNQTMPPGTLAFFADGGFAGETLLERLKPGDVRVLGFGVDLDVSLDVADTVESEEVRAVSSDGAALTEHFVKRRILTCDLDNRSGTAREVYFTLPVVDNARVVGADALDFDTQAKTPLARFDVAPKTTLSKTLRVEEGLRRAHPLATLTRELVARVAASPKLAEPQKRSLGQVAMLLGRAEAWRVEKDRIAAEQKTALDDMKRLREHMAAGRGDDKEPFAARILEVEDRLKVIRTKVAAAERAEATLRELVAAELVRLKKA